MKYVIIDNNLNFSYIRRDLQLINKVMFFQFALNNWTDS